MSSPRESLAEVRRSVEKFHAEAQKLVAQVRKEGTTATARALRAEAGKLLTKVEGRTARLREQLDSVSAAARTVPGRVRQRVRNVGTNVRKRIGTSSHTQPPACS